MSYQESIFGEQHLRYKLEQLKKTGTFDIMNNISEYVRLVLLFLVSSGTNFHLELSHAVHTRLRKY